MKKLAILLFAWAIVSSVTAAPIWIVEYNEGVVTVSVLDNPEAPVNLVLTVYDGGVLSNFAMGADAPVDSTYIGDVHDIFPELGQGEIWVMAHITTGTLVYVDGDWLTADFTYTGGSVDIRLYEYIDATNECVLLGSTSIPEPGTMALLCLGGLILRRRK